MSDARKQTSVPQRWGAPLAELFPYQSEWTLKRIGYVAASLSEGFCPGCKKALTPADPLPDDLVRGRCDQCGVQWWMRNDPEYGAEYGWRDLKASHFMRSREVRKVMLDG